jgi:hypothetical protein
VCAHFSGKDAIAQALGIFDFTLAARKAHGKLVFFRAGGLLL